MRRTLGRVGGSLVETRPAVGVEVLRKVRAHQRAERIAAGSEWHTGPGYVFATETGQPVDPSNAGRAFTSAAFHGKTARRSEISLHTLRHTAASLMHTSGVPLFVVSRYLGHGSTQVTSDLYGHLHPDSLRLAADRLGESLASVRFARELTSKSNVTAQFRPVRMVPSPAGIFV